MPFAGEALALWQIAYLRRSPATFFYRLYKMVVAKSMNKYKRKTHRKKGVSNVTKTKYQKPSAQNQKRQILTNARHIAYLNKMVKSNRIYCDWQRSSEINAPVDMGGGFTTFWGIRPLTDLAGWRACLRQSDAVLHAARTFISRLQLNMRYQLGNSNYAQMNIFIVTPRKDYNGEDPAVTPPVLGQGYIEGYRGYNVRLNPAMFKVHYARYMSLTKNSWLEPAADANNPVGNPYSTFKKGQITIPVKMTVRAPFSSPDDEWHRLNYVDLPYYHRYYLMCYIVQQAPPGTAEDTAASITYDQLATTINFE